MALAKKEFELCEGIGDIDFPCRLAAYALAECTLLRRYPTSDLVRLLAKTELIDQPETEAIGQAVEDICSGAKLWRHIGIVACTPIKSASSGIDSVDYQFESHMLWTHLTRLTHVLS